MELIAAELPPGPHARSLIVDLQELSAPNKGENNGNMPQRLLLCAVLAVCHYTQTCTGFNIDERFPVIKEGKTSGSLFGFSVALHEKTVGSRQYL